MTRTLQRGDWLVASVSGGGVARPHTQWALYAHPNYDQATLSTDLDRLKHEAIRRAMVDGVSAWRRQGADFELMHAQSSGD